MLRMISTFYASCWLSSIMIDFRACLVEIVYHTYSIFLQKSPRDIYICLKITLFAETNIKGRIRKKKTRRNKKPIR